MNYLERINEISKKRQRILNLEFDTLINEIFKIFEEDSNIFKIYIFFDYTFDDLAFSTSKNLKHAKELINWFSIPTLYEHYVTCTSTEDRRRFIEDLKCNLYLKTNFDFHEVHEHNSYKSLCVRLPL